MNNILITGGAGFIGFHLCKELVKYNYNIITIDNINDYYDVSLKEARLNKIGIDVDNAKEFNKKVKSNIFKNLTFIRLDICNDDELNKIFDEYKFNIVCNLAAQAGVRYSILNPKAYIDSNISGFLNILESSKKFNVEKLVYASSSSVYGNTKNIPFSETENSTIPLVCMLQLKYQMS